MGLRVRKAVANGEDKNKVFSIWYGAGAARVKCEKAAYLDCKIDLNGKISLDWHFAYLVYLTRLLIDLIVFLSPCLK